MRIFLFLLLSFKTYGYSFTGDFSAGIYWRGFPISAIVSDSSEQSRDFLKSLTDQAVAQWEAVVGREVWSVSSSSGGLSGGNSIRWSNNFAADTGYNPQTTLAVTVRYRTGTYFDRFEIILNGENTAMKMNSNNMLFQTILHELGHVIGLDHSEFSNAVMYASLQGISNLSFDDAQGANAAVDENLHRQAVGFVSELAADENNSSSSPLACGTIALMEGGSGGGPSSGLFSLVLGVLLSIAFKLLAGKKIPHYQFKLGLVD